MYFANDFTLRAFSFIALVLKYSEIWRVKKARFSRFLYKSVLWCFCYGLHSHFIDTGSPSFVIGLLKQIPSEDYESK
jgi:hypothetical protein